MFQRESELALLRGFCPPGVNLPHGARKVLAVKMRARLGAASTVNDRSIIPPRRLLAEATGLTERHHLNVFPELKSIFAFPPPELAAAVVGMSAQVLDLLDLRLPISTVLHELESNVIGKQLMKDLVAVHARQPSLELSDGYFASEIRRGLQHLTHCSGKQVRGLSGFFTEGVREAFRDWGSSEEVSLDVVRLSIDHLIINVPRAGLVSESGDLAKGVFGV
jgi:hypothetical protein